MNPNPVSPYDECVEKVRSKNAGPFWVTIDIFCQGDSGFQQVAAKLQNEQIASLLHCPTASLKRFDIPDLGVIKISLPRPQIQGTMNDRDMHGAAIAVLIEEHLAAVLVSPD